MMIDTEDQDRLRGENRTRYHVIKSRKPKHKRTIQQTQDEHGTTRTNTMAIMRALKAPLGTKYRPIQIEEGNVQHTLNCELKETTNVMNTTLEEPITINEQWRAINKGKQHKAHGQVGIGLEFYEGAWEVIKTDGIGL